MRKRIKYGKLSLERKQLATDYMPFALNLINQYPKLKKLFCRELVSEVLFSLAKSAYRYNPKKNVKFTTYAAFSINGAIKDWKRKEFKSKKYKQKYKHDTISYYLDKGFECTGDFDRIDAMDEFEWWLKKLPQRHQTIMKKIYLEDQNQHETAKLLKMSESRISCLHKEALEILRDIYQSLAERGKPVPDLPFRS